jgi:hypothetical protein
MGVAPCLALTRCYVPELDMDLDLIVSSGEKGFWNESVLGVYGGKNKKKGLKRNSITRKSGRKTVNVVKRPRPKRN